VDGKKKLEEMTDQSKRKARTHHQKKDHRIKPAKCELQQAVTAQIE